MFNESGLKIFNQSPFVGNLAVFLLIGGDLLIYFDILPFLHQHINTSTQLTLPKMELLLIARANGIRQLQKNRLL